MKKLVRKIKPFQIIFVCVFMYIIVGLGMYQVWSYNHSSVQQPTTLQKQVYLMLRWPALFQDFMEKNLTKSRLSKVKNQSENLLTEEAAYFSSTYQGRKKIIWKDELSIVLYDPNIETNNIESPIYLKERLIQSLSNGNYVEIDLRHQMLLIYKQHILDLHTPIISGNPNHPSPEGVFEVLSKHQGAYLSGMHPNYHKPYQISVDYWINFYQQQYGIHESDWHRYFGGNQYLKYGSLGCINIPAKTMEIIYHHVNEGDLLIVHR